MSDDLHLVNERLTKQREQLRKVYLDTQEPYTEEELRSEGYKSLHNQLLPIAMELIEKAKDAYNPHA